MLIPLLDDHVMLLSIMFFLILFCILCHDHIIQSFAGYLSEARSMVELLC